MSMKKVIGGGTQGAVLATTSGTAIKAFIHKEHYITERDVYLRLREHNVGNLAGFNVPRMINFHDELLIIEMEIVLVPFVLDFASAYLDSEPPYFDDQQIMESWEKEKREQFEDRWPEVKSLISLFKGLGIHLADVKPGNIMFAD